MSSSPSPVDTDSARTAVVYSPISKLVAQIVLGESKIASVVFYKDFIAVVFSNDCVKLFDLKGDNVATVETHDGFVAMDWLFGVFQGKLCFLRQEPDEAPKDGIVHVRVLDIQITTTSTGTTAILNDVYKSESAKIIGRVCICDGPLEAIVDGCVTFGCWCFNQQAAMEHPTVHGGIRGTVTIDSLYHDTYIRMVQVVVEATKTNVWFLSHVLPVFVEHQQHDRKKTAIRLVLGPNVAVSIPLDVQDSTVFDTTKGMPPVEVLYDEVVPVEGANESRVLAARDCEEGRKFLIVTHDGKIFMCSAPVE